MKLLKKVEKIKVKQAFVIADVFAFKRENIDNLSKYVPTLDIEKSNFSKELEKVKKRVFRLDEKTLDKIIYDEFPPRLAAFNSVEWYLGHMAIDEIGVWKGAGGLPDSWTEGSLKETADMIVNETDVFKKNIDLLSGDKRAMKAVPYFIRFKQSCRRTNSVSHGWSIAGISPTPN